MKKIFLILFVSLFALNMSAQKKYTGYSFRYAYDRGYDTVWVTPIIVKYFKSPLIYEDAADFEVQFSKYLRRNKIESWNESGLFYWYDDKEYVEKKLREYMQDWEKDDMVIIHLRDFKFHQDD